MVDTEQDIIRLHNAARETDRKDPNVVINQCTGWLGAYETNGHRTFVVMRLVNGRWETMAEYDRLDDALAYPGAVPYGSSTVCSACKTLAKRR